MAEPRRYSVPQVARLLNISERAVRKRISAGTLQAEREGGHWVVLLAEPEGGTGAVPDGTETEPSGTAGGTTPAEIERAIARTGQQYTADLQTILAELRQVYEGQVAAQQETIATQRDLIDNQDDQLADLRGRLAAAEAERDQLRHQVAPQPLSAAASNPAQVEASAPPVAAQGFWVRVRRVFGGE